LDDFICQTNNLGKNKMEI